MVELAIPFPAGKASFHLARIPLIARWYVVSEIGLIRAVVWSGENNAAILFDLQVITVPFDYEPGYVAQK